MAAAQDVSVEELGNVFLRSNQKKLSERGDVENFIRAKKGKLEPAYLSGIQIIKYDGTIYTGMFENGKPNGQGKGEKWGGNGDTYEGEFKDGFPTANTTYFNAMYNKTMPVEGWDLRSDELRYYFLKNVFAKKK